MKRFFFPLVLLVAIALSGCSFATKTPVPTNTPTQGLIIRVATPTPGASPSPRPTLTPTLSVTSTITATIEIPTATPTPFTVVELPNASGYAWQVVVNGLDMPTGLVNAGDGSGRLFIVEQGGLIRILMDGNILSTPFLDLTTKISCCGEQGLLGLAFHPKYPENGYFYVDYTEKVNNQLFTVVSRYTVSGDDPNQADPGSEMRILHIEQPFQNHNGGELQFGPEGYLYVAMGDGGSFGDPNGNGQSLQTLLGKILRIDVDSCRAICHPTRKSICQWGWNVGDLACRITQSLEILF